jgi:hypothetical protein
MHLPPPLIPKRVDVLLPEWIGLRRIGFPGPGRQIAIVHDEPPLSS